MANRKRLIPFRLLPGSWGLSGNTYAVAKAEYELEGYELDKELHKIKCLNLDSTKDKITIGLGEIDVDLKYNKISQEEYERKSANLYANNDDDLKLRNLLIDLNHKKITQSEYNKQTSTIKKEPWVDVTGLQIDPKNPKGSGAFTIEWNEYFIQELAKNGYTGMTPEEKVQDWFDTLCRILVKETGILTEAEPVVNIGPDGEARKTYF